MSDLPDRLREAATGLSDNLGGSVTAAESVHLMREAADALEGYEAAERERLEREAVESETVPTIDIPWPLIPMPQDYPTMFECTAAMVEWGKRVSRLKGVRMTEATQDAAQTMPRPIVCSVCGVDWMLGNNHSIWCGGFGRPHGKPVPLIGPLPLHKRST